jgi:TNF receptor-associated protein 1
MVGDKITVFTKSAKSGSQGYCWTSDGLGAYEIAEAEGVSVGTKIVIHLNKESKEYSAEARIKGKRRE